MNEWTRLLLYGTYDGFSRSTEGENNIILILDNGDRVEVPNHFVKNTSDFVERNKIKLKDIIARMEGLNGLTRIEWLDDILYKFGSNYGASKYKSGYEQGKLEGEWVGQQLKDADKIRQELNKPIVPQFVADWIEKAKGWSKTLYYALDHSPEEVNLWFCEDEVNRQNIFARAWLDGYEVEKEKRYLVKMKNAYYNKYPQFLCETDNGIFWAAEIDLRKTKFTRKELKQSGFGWVFDCPGVEIEEVQEG